MTEVIEVKTRRELGEFISLPYRLYRRDPYFVAPLRAQIRDILTGKGNVLFNYGPHAMLLCRRQGKTVGRILVGVDETYNRQNGYQSAWISLFECEKNEESAKTLMQACEDWALQHGADYLRGPEPPDNGENFKGILVMGFDGPPAMMNSYNPPWYGEFFEQQGFSKQRDLFAYSFKVSDIFQANNERVISYAMNKYEYHVDRIDIKNLDRDLRDIHEVMAITIPTFADEHMAPPSFDDIRQMADNLLPVADPDLICIARTNQGNRPIGLVLALPDYNQVFRHIRDGRLYPFGILKLLYYRRKIRVVRVFTQFVIPEYQRKAVNNAIFFEMCRTASSKGYLTGDGSTIGETNRQSRASVERLGGVHYRTYRIYKKKIRPD